MTEEQTYLICVNWGDETVVSVLRHCFRCSRAVAMDANNINISEQKKVKHVCLNCMKKMAGEAGGWNHGGIQAGGKLYTAEETGLTKERVNRKLGL